MNDDLGVVTGDWLRGMSERVSPPAFNATNVYAHLGGDWGARRWLLPLIRGHLRGMVQRGELIAVDTGRKGREQDRLWLLPEDEPHAAHLGRRVGGRVSAWVVVVSRRRLDVFTVFGATWHEAREKFCGNGALWRVPEGVVVEGLTPSELLALVDDDNATALPPPQNPRNPLGGV